MSYPDLSQPFRDALLANTTITSALSNYKNSKPIFTRRPVPSDAPTRVIVISPDISKSDADGLSDLRPVITRDVSVYGNNEPASEYRAVEDLARTVHDVFHRQRNALTVPGWTVFLVMCHGPIPAPVDDDQTVGRLVTVTVQLAQLR